MIKAYRTTLLALMIAFSLVGCQATLQEKGNIIKMEDLAKIKEKVTTQEEVFQILGSPSFVNSYQKHRWIYIQDRRFESYRMLNRVEIVFNDKKIVETVTRNFQDKLHDPRDLAGYTEETPWYNQWKLRRGQHEGGIDQAVITPNETEPQNKTWWKFWKGSEENPVYIRPELEQRDVLPKSASTTLWDRLTTFTNTPKPAVEAPSTEFTPAESGWWKGMFQQDPVAEAAQTTEQGGGSVKAAEILFSNQKTPAPHSEATPIERAPVESAPPAEESGKPWWKLW